LGSKPIFVNSNLIRIIKYLKVINPLVPESINKYGLIIENFEEENSLIFLSKIS
jgi:hypothetical protein